MLQIVGILGTALDPILLTRALGLESSAQYAIASRLFSAAALVQFFILPMWPAFGEALARGDSAWAKRALHKCLLWSLIISTLTGVLIAFAVPFLTKTWVPQIRAVPVSVLLAFVAAAPLGAYGGTMSAILNNRGTLRSQLFFYGAASVAAFVLKIVLIPVVGASGVVWGTVLGYGIFYVVPAWRLAQRALSSDASRQRWRVA
jgi:O-antigen/teichoic acid export membrane protein